MNKKTRKRFEHGQSLVEFAISGMLLVLLFSGLVDLARVYFTYIALEDAAGEAALYLSINPLCPEQNGDPDCANPNNARWRAQNAVRGQLADFVDWGAPTTVIQPDFNGFPVVGGTVSVTITYDHTLITPLIRNLAGGGTITLQVDAHQTIVAE